MQYPRAPSYLNSRLLACESIGYIEPGTHYLGNWSPGGSHLHWDPYRSTHALGFWENMWTLCCM